MSRIILDFGSGNTCKNDLVYITKMIDQLAEVDTGEHEIIIKWQLFEKAGANIPLERQRFHEAYHYAKGKGYKTTSSVFDLESLKFLLYYDVPFIKIANNRDLDWLIEEVPRKVRVYVSTGDTGLYEWQMINNGLYMACISQYPALLTDYELRFEEDLEDVRKYLSEDK